MEYNLGFAHFLADPSTGPSEEPAIGSAAPGRSDRRLAVR